MTEDRISVFIVDAENGETQAENVKIDFNHDKQAMTIRYGPHKTATAFVAVRVDGQPLPGSPFFVQAKIKCAVDKCVLETPVGHELKRKETVAFTVLLRDSDDRPYVSGDAVALLQADPDAAVTIKPLGPSVDDASVHRFEVTPLASRGTKATFKALVNGTALGGPPAAFTIVHPLDLAASTASFKLNTTAGALLPSTLGSATRSNTSFSLSATIVDEKGELVDDLSKDEVCFRLTAEAPSRKIKSASIRQALRAHFDRFASKETNHLEKHAFGQLCGHLFGGEIGQEQQERCWASVSANNQPVSFDLFYS